MKLSVKEKQSIWAYIFIIIPLLFFILIRILPALYAFNVSLHSWDLLSQDKPFVYLQNYKEIFKDTVFKDALINTLKYVFIGVPLQLILSLIVALMLNKIKRFESLFRVVYFIPYITSVVAVSWVWRWMFMKEGGAINSILSIIGLPAQAFLNSTSQAIYVVIGTIVWQSIGFNTIIFLAGIKQIPDSFYEASSIDGASPWTQFKKITIPLLNPTLVYLTVMSTIQTLQVFTQVVNITGSGGANAGGPLNSTISFVLYIYQLAFVNHKMGYASAVTFVLFILILLISLIQLKFFTKRVDY